MDEKTEILAYLKKRKEVSATKIYRTLNIHYYKVKMILQELLKEKKIKVSTQKRHHTYYSYDKEGNNENIPKV